MYKKKLSWKLKDHFHTVVHTQLHRWILWGDKFVCQNSTVKWQLWYWSDSCSAVGCRNNSYLWWPVFVECDNVSWALMASVAPLPRDWNHRSGRPYHTWLHTVESLINIGLAAACRWAQNRHEHTCSNVSIRWTSHTMMIVMMMMLNSAWSIIWF